MPVQAWHIRSTHQFHLELAMMSWMHECRILVHECMPTILFRTFGLEAVALLLLVCCLPAVFLPSSVAAAAMVPFL